MTENQWPQDGSYASSPTTQQAPGAPGTTPGTGTDPSTLDAIKDEAGNAVEQAKESATTVVETAKTEAANVAAEVKSNAKDLLDQAKLDLTDQAGKQQQKIAAGLRSISEELRSMANASNDPGVATDLVRQAAERSSSVATWLDDREPGSIVDEVKTFARRRPGAFLLLAAGAGVLAGRLSRSLSAGTDGSTRRTATNRAAPQSEPQSDRDAAHRFVPGAGMTVPPPPVQLPGPGVTTAGYGGTQSLNEDGPTAPAAYPPDPVYGTPGREQREAEPRFGADPGSGGPR
jgi:vacuolar-type H+-ATPase subunit H